MSMVLMPFLTVAAVAAPPTAAVVAPQVQSSQLSCLPAGITRGATVVALSAYQSSEGRAMPFMLAGSNNNAVHLLTVTGTGSRPIVLVVSAYEPILWDLSAVKDRVRAVVASGYYPQAVRGVAPEIPIRFSSSVGKFNGAETCAHVGYAYDETEGIQKVATDIKSAIGVYPRVFYGKYSTPRFDVDGPGAVPPGGQDFSDIRTAVPLITAEDPASKAQMHYLPSPDESEGGPRLRIVEWNDAGKVVHDEGGRKPVTVSALRSPAPSESPRPRKSAGATLIEWLTWLAVGGFVFWQWRRSPRLAAARHAQRIAPPAPLPPTAPLAAVITAAPSTSHKQLADLAALAAITDCEPLVVALHRYGREVQMLPRLRFDPNLAEEIGAIVEHHFDHAIGRYRQVRPSLTGEEGARADAMLTRAIERLTLRLQELQAEQQHRDVDGVDEAARFIDARHPV